MEPRRLRANKKQKHHTFRNFVLIIILLILVVMVGGYGYYRYSLKPINPKNHNQIEIQITPGETSDQVASDLKKDKVIRSPYVFKHYITKHNLNNIQSGYFIVQQDMTLSQIANRLNQQGAASSNLAKSNSSLLIIEGERIDQIANAIPEHSNFTKQQFLNLMKDKAFLKQLSQKYPELLDSAVKSKHTRYPLEGYLYPAVYNTKKYNTLKDLVTQMVATTNDNVKPYLDKFKSENLTVQQALTLASLVEKEARTPKDMQLVAGVFLNRLDKNMPIQSDVSIQYALNTNKKNLSIKDTQVNSPYNLYRHKGLGPGPFNNPGLEAIKAVANPLDRDKGYLYFVANMKTGKIHFSTTLNQQNQYTKKYEKDNQ